MDIAPLYFQVLTQVSMVKSETHSNHFFSLHLKLMPWAGAIKVKDKKSKYMDLFQTALLINAGFFQMLTILDEYMYPKTADWPHKMCLKLIIFVTQYEMWRGYFYGKQLRKILDDIDACVKLYPQPLWKYEDDDHEGWSNQKEPQRNNKPKHLKKRRTTYGWAVTVNRISIWMLTIDMTVSIFPVTLPTFQGNFLCTCFYPFNDTTGIVFAMASFFIYFATYMWIFALVNYFTLFFKIGVTLCSQLEGIANNFRQVGNTPQTENETEQEYQMRTKEELRASIEHHQCLLRILPEVNEFFSPIFFNLFATVAADICFAVYIGLSAEKFDNKVAASFNILTNQLAILSVFCWLGTMIADRMAQVAEAVYESDWVKGDLSLMTSILIVMRQGYKDFHLSAGWFSLSLPALASILEDAGSYVMLMLALYEN